MHELDDIQEPKFVQFFKLYKRINTEKKDRDPVLRLSYHEGILNKIYLGYFGSVKNIKDYCDMKDMESQRDTADMMVLYVGIKMSENIEKLQFIKDNNIDSAKCQNELYDFDIDNEILDASIILGHYNLYKYMCTIVTCYNTNYTGSCEQKSFTIDTLNNDHKAIFDDISSNRIFNDLARKILIP